MRSPASCGGKFAIKAAVLTLLVTQAALVRGCSFQILSAALIRLLCRRPSMLVTTLVETSLCLGLVQHACSGPQLQRHMLLRKPRSQLPTPTRSTARLHRMIPSCPRPAPCSRKDNTTSLSCAQRVRACVGGLEPPRGGQRQRNATSSGLSRRTAPLWLRRVQTCGVCSPVCCWASC